MGLIKRCWSYLTHHTIFIVIFGPRPTLNKRRILNTCMNIDWSYYPIVIILLRSSSKMEFSGNKIQRLGSLNSLSLRHYITGRNEKTRFRQKIGHFYFFVASNQCDQIGRFLKFLGNKVPYTSVQTFVDFLKHHS